MSLIQLRRDTAANWTSANPTLSAGEIGVEVDTNKFKIGDGSTAWASLAYQGGWTPPSPSTHNFISHDGTSWVMTSMTPTNGDVPYFNGSSWGTSQLPSGLPAGTSYQMLYHDGSAWVATSMTPTNGDVLTFNGTAWTSSAPSGGGLSPGSSAGDVLTWNGSSWGSAAPAVSSINSYTGAVSLSYSDVGAMPAISGSTYQMIYHDGMNWVSTSMTPTNGDVLTFNGTAWTSSAPSGGLSPGVNNGDVLTWNGASWTSAAPTDAVTSVNSYTGAVSLSYSDVGAMQNVTGTSNGDVLTWNGSSWTSAAPSAGIPNGTAPDQVLTWNGSSWNGAAPPAGAVSSVNAYTGAVTLSASDVGAVPMVTGASAGDVMTFDGTAWSYSTPGTLPTPGSANDVVYWTGSNWATQPVTNLLPSISSGYVLGYDSMSGWQGYALPSGLSPGSTSNNVAYWNGSAWSDTSVTSLFPSITSGQVLGYDSFSGWQGYSLPVGLPSAVLSGEIAYWNGSSWVAQKLNANDIDWSTVPTSPGSPGTIWNNGGILQIA